MATAFPWLRQLSNASDSAALASTHPMQRQFSTESGLDTPRSDRGSPTRPRINTAPGQRTPPPRRMATLRPVSPPVRGSNRSRAVSDDFRYQYERCTRRWRTSSSGEKADGKAPRSAPPCEVTSNGKLYFQLTANKLQLSYKDDDKALRSTPPGEEKNSGKLYFQLTANKLQLSYEDAKVTPKPLVREATPKAAAAVGLTHHHLESRDDAIKPDDILAGKGSADGSTSAETSSNDDVDGGVGAGTTDAKSRLKHCTWVSGLPLQQHVSRNDYDSVLTERDSLREAKQVLVEEKLRLETEVSGLKTRNQHLMSNVQKLSHRDAAASRGTMVVALGLTGFASLACYRIWRNKMC